MTTPPSDLPNELHSQGFASTLAGDALDRLIARRAAEANGPPLPASPLTREERAIESLLALLDAPLPGGMHLLEDNGPVAGPSRSLLVDVTMARVLRAREQDLAGRIGRPRSPDALAETSALEVDAHFSSPDLAPPSGPAHSRVAALLSLLDARDPDSAPADCARLIDATLAKIDSASEHARRRFLLSPVRGESAAPRPGWRVADLGAIAAVLLVGTSLLSPMFNHASDDARRTMCAANLGRTAAGFAMYAADHRGALPQQAASFLGGTWWDVGNAPRSHSANLYLLVSGGYTPIGALACPGNQHAPVLRTDFSATDWRRPEEISFSYQLPTPGRPGWAQLGRTVVLTDRSPIIERARRGEAFNPLASSHNHAGQGQNVLFADGSVVFYTQPVLESGDNMWLPSLIPNPSRSLTGRETPTTDSDAFVGP
ncbi:MAG: hypothetical protein SFZ24_02680 [Planctomycetota bacterium]|nr:hypothetical protein [Planctomycetota bacterium]